MATKKRKLTNKDRARIERERRMKLSKKPTFTKSKSAFNNLSDLERRLLIAQMGFDILVTSRVYSFKEL